MCKEGAGKRKVTREVRPQKRGSTPERECARNKEIKREKAEGEGQRN